MKLTLSKEVNLAKEPIGHLLWVLAVPAITSQVVNALYNMVDRMYIGHIPEIGSVALTGVGVCFPLIMIVSAFAYLFGMGGAPRASIYMGKKQNDMAEKIMGNSFVSLCIIAILLTIAMLIGTRPLLYLFGASANTIGYAMDYIQIYAIGTIFVQLTLGLNAFISCQGFSLISMFTVCIGAVTNIVLDPIFIFGFGMGVQGAALATVLSQAFSAAWAIYFLCSSKSVLRLQKKESSFERTHHASMYCIRCGSFLDAGDREYSGSLFQFLTFKIWRRFSGRCYDHSFQCDAVCHVATAGNYTRWAADH